MPAGLRAQLDLTSSPIPSSYYGGSEDDTPYHRVVSAPPGRIGVTFVEFRGHAMVSDVAPDSPLSSWVFPSDILIAIDEVPVSGMRVRDIIKVLTNRRDRQRALRVISSHAMNEFTLNGSILNEEQQS
jgi:C-terminal processing protease CtpA/Prc